MVLCMVAFCLAEVFLVSDHQVSDDVISSVIVIGGIMSETGIEIEVSPCDCGGCSALFNLRNVHTVFSVLAMVFTCPAAFCSFPCVQNSALSCRNSCLLSRASVMFLCSIFLQYLIICFMTEIVMGISFLVLNWSWASIWSLCLAMSFLK